MIINHQVGISGNIEAVYKALSSVSGLMGWWTNDVSGSADIGSVLAFRFNGGGPDFEVGELVPNSKVVWQHRGDIPQEWQGTEISFSLTSTETQVIVRFRHANWQSTSNFMAHCSTKWAVFLLSLKDLIETGKGKPFPNDIQIAKS